MTLSSKLVLHALLVLALAGTIATAVREHGEIDRARAEQANLRSESQEAQRLAEENKGISAMRESGAESEKLRAENKDLPALRNDVRQLRRAVADVEKLRVENQQLLAKINAAQGPGAVPPGFIPRAAMQDVGTSTPEAAVQSFLWAMSQGNLERIKQLAVDSGPALGPNTDHQRSDLVRQAQGFPGFAIAGKKSFRRMKLKSVCKPRWAEQSRR